MIQTFVTDFKISRALDISAFNVWVFKNKYIRLKLRRIPELVALTVSSYVGGK